MPKASISEYEAKSMRMMKMKDEKDQDDKLKALDRAQKEGLVKQKELAREFKRSEEEQKQSRDDPDFLIRESKHE